MGAVVAVSAAESIIAWGTVVPGAIEEERNGSLLGRRRFPTRAEQPKRTQEYGEVLDKEPAGMMGTTKELKR
jgi:hypothetical protein